MIDQALVPVAREDAAPKDLGERSTSDVFDDQAEEAVKFYVSLFKNSKIESVSRYGDEGQEITGRPPGSVMTISFRLDGQEFVALNGGPHFKFTEAISLVVNCETQAEVNRFWEKLSQGGSKGQCGRSEDVV